MNNNPQYDAPITTQMLKDLGFHQLEASSFSNGSFDLILSDSGDAILYAHENTRSVNYISDGCTLQSFVNYTIIASVGVNGQ